MQELGTAHALFDSSYGQVLLVKIGLIALMIPLSFLAWRRGRPPSPHRGDACRVRDRGGVRPGRLPHPTQPACAEQVGSREVITDPAWPREGDLTLGGRAGSVLVGLTLRPGHAGRNDVLVYVLPLQGGRAAAQLPVSVQMGGKSLPTETCGADCRRITVAIAVDENLVVRVGGDGGGAAAFHVPRLPAPDGASVFAAVQSAMHSLHTYRLQETSGTGTSAIRSTYAFRAPDELSVRQPTGFGTVWIGSTRYLKQRRGSGWIVQPDAGMYSVPSFIWDYVPDHLLDVRVVGRARVYGRRTRILSFFGPELAAPIWFRLWVDPSGLVLKAQMRAQGHFMDHRYYGFDLPVSIAPPAGAG